MSHILKKLQIAGAGKKSKPKPPIYRPPVMGQLQYGASFSYAETLDLISDGPIEGLVDPLGKVMKGINILQGVYLNDTAVAISNANASRTSISPMAEQAATTSAMALSSGSGTGIRSLRNFFKAINQQGVISTDGKISTLAHSNTAGTRNPYEDGMLPNVSFLFIKVRRKTGNSANLLPDELPDFHRSSLYIRAFIDDSSTIGQDFFWYLEKVLNSGDAGKDENHAAFRDENFPRGGTTMAGWENVHVDQAGTGRPQSLYWTDSEPPVGLDEDDLLSGTERFSTCKFFLGFGHHKYGNYGGGYLGQFARTNLDAEDFVETELAAIIKLWNDNVDSNADEPNPYQWKLADNALTALGWDGEQTDPTGLLSNSLRRNRSLIAIIKADEEGNLNLLGKTVVKNSQTKTLRDLKTVLYGANEGWNLELALEGAGAEFNKIDVTCPEVDSDGKLNGNMRGFILLTFGHTSKSSRDIFADYTLAFRAKLSRLLADVQSLQYTHVLEGGVTPINENENSSNLKFNYTNILAEVRNGEENQEPLNSFRRVFIDHIYNEELFGPFGTATAGGDKDVVGDQTNAPQRIFPDKTKMLRRDHVLSLGAANFNLALDGGGLPIDEGSSDVRKTKGNFSEWGVNSLITWEERAIPSIHTVYNPNVTKAFITLNIQSLSDTLVKKVDDVEPEDKNMGAGTKFPTVLNIEVETGTLGKYKDGAKGGQNPFRKYHYRIVALIEGQALVDIGNPDNTRGPSHKDFIVNLDEPEQTDLSIPFILPKVKQNTFLYDDDDDTVGVVAGAVDQEGLEKRYVKVTKLSYETNSILIEKIVSLYKVTEIIEIDMPYPLSAIVGTKMDSRAFGSLPKRSYDCKLKLVKIPNNYFPTKDGVDRRYYRSTDEFDATEKSNKYVYEGDWDGDFHLELRWTDNPAWILYDLLTNGRYGMGSHIDADKINKWQLYKIGRFCDAVDDNGYFEGVSDGHGGLEPRFSCNIVFDKGQKLYDAITTITEIFRGRVFFGNSEINFVDDRPRGSINLFTNESVKDGHFFYSNNRRDQQYNTIEVGFRDRFDNFSPQIEVIEDEEDIRERGVFKTKIAAVGITSRAMARRVGQHKIFSSIEENQTVAFTAGLESLLCQPGDLITIEDELKTNRANFGRILDVDIENETIRISNTFVEDDMLSGKFTVYSPTGRDTIEGISEFADIHRNRYESFTITGESQPWERYTGSYEFSGYISGYNVTFRDERFQEYGLYTGVSGTFLYFETGVTGWIFGSGTGENTAFDLASGDFISELTGAQSLISFNTGKIVEVDMTDGSAQRSTDPAEIHYPFSGFDEESFVGREDGTEFHGVQDSEISGSSPQQMAVLSVTGKLLRDPDQLELEGFNPYGSLLSGFDKPHLLPFVKLGSPAKFEIRDASPFIYKVIAMKEDAPNEYLISATKYDTGKFKLIEEDISIENKADTLSWHRSQTVHGTEYSTLNAPVIDSLTTGEPDAASDTFTITGKWTDVTEGTGYNIRLTQPNGSLVEDFITDTGHEFTGLGQVGVFNFCVNALGNRGGSEEENVFLDSTDDCSGIFVVYDELLLFNRSFVQMITIL